MTRLQRVDPELAVGLQLFPVIEFSDHAALLELRKHIVELNKTLAAEMPLPADVQREVHAVPGPQGAPPVNVYLYRPAQQTTPLPVLLWIHGGGYVFGQAVQEEFVAAQIVRSANCIVVSVDYRLAPEAPFPAPLEDCYAVLRWLAQSGAELRIDTQRIAIGGASAGGGLAAGLGLLARDRAAINVCFQLLIYPMLDDRNTTPSSMAADAAPLWNRANNIFGWSAYLGHDIGRNDVAYHAVPARAPDLRGLPPTFLAVGDLDLFVDEDLNYAQRLIQAGVPTELHVYDRACHGFDMLAPMGHIAAQFAAARAQALQRAFS